MDKYLNRPPAGKDAQSVRIFSAVIALLLTALTAAPTLAADSIQLDGQFSDWQGQPAVEDPQGDARNGQTDIKAFYFATGQDSEAAYFMLERWEPGAQQVDYVLWVDTNNNGNYSEALDRKVGVTYRPNSNGATDVDLFDGSGNYLRTIASSAPWGEGGQGARVEFAISFADLGIAPYQTIRLEVVSMQGNTVSDEAAEVQWSPADALGPLALAGLALAGAVLLFIRRKKIEWPRH